MNKILKINPHEIEGKSFEIITNELGERKFDPTHDPIIKRVIHTTADFDYADNMKFSDTAVKTAIDVLKGGCSIVTDTKMAASGINKGNLSLLGCSVNCYMTDNDVAESATKNRTTRAAECMIKASLDKNNKIFAIGNAPTALIQLYELIKNGRVKPDLIIGVPVGFVNVIESKELIKEAGIPYIIAEGRKGGSNVAAAIVNALMIIASKK